jgi:hypothetical protein
VRTIQPDELASDRPHGPWSCRGRDIWETFCAAVAGDAGGLRRLLQRDPNLYRYLRLNGAPVPSIYGPSADEARF